MNCIDSIGYYMSLMKFKVFLFSFTFTLNKISQWTTLHFESHASTEYVDFTVDTVKQRMK